MSLMLNDFLPAAPEIFLLSMTCLILLVDVYVPERYRLVTYQLSQASLVVTAILVMLLYPAESVLTFSDSFVLDRMGSVLKVFVLLMTYFAFFYSKEYLRARNLFKGEFYLLGLFAVLGMMVLISGHSFLTLYLGLELLSLALYALVALHRDSIVASEAAMKYFILAALASGILLYGISLLYGATGTLDIGELRSAIGAEGEGRNIVLMLGLVFVVVGIAFKLGAVPFHMWVPDLYQGAPTPVTLFVGTAPKLAGFAMLMRFLVDGMVGLRGDWSDMLILLAILSLAVGNVVAIAQTNLKRMLGYSTIAHMGYMFLGLIAGTAAGYAASMFYIIVYALMAMGGFGMIILLSRAGFESDRLDDFRGLNERSPWYAFLMLILMLSMGGLPPFLGFWAKWSVLRELVAVDMVWLAVVSVVFSLIGLFYYIRIVRLMYFEKPTDHSAVAAPADMRVMISTNALAILALGLYPGALMALCISAFAI